AVIQRVAGAGFDQVVRHVVVYDLGCAGGVDVDLEEVSEVAVALRGGAPGAPEADVEIVHRVRRRLDQGGRRRCAGDGARDIGGEYQFVHEDVPHVAARAEWGARGARLQGG